MSGQIPLPTRAITLNELEKSALKLDPPVFPLCRTRRHCSAGARLQAGGTDGSYRNKGRPAPVSGQGNALRSSVSSPPVRVVFEPSLSETPGAPHKPGTCGASPRGATGMWRGNLTCVSGGQIGRAFFLNSLVAGGEVQSARLSHPWTGTRRRVMLTAMFDRNSLVFHDGNLAESDGEELQQPRRKPAQTAIYWTRGLPKGVRTSSSFSWGVYIPPTQFKEVTDDVDTSMCKKHAAHIWGTHPARAPQRGYPADGMLQLTVLAATNMVHVWYACSRFAVQTAQLVTNRTGRLV
ncbi:hypothetical protein Bbelb_260810 [Branchiostoma belcheri]|nr:hypothetical protein Bbelb_260810 [Branchiostoma belcheri]